MIPHEAQQKGAAANRAQAEERDRAILALLDTGITYVELAAELGVKPENVRTIVSRARKRLGVETPRSGSLARVQAAVARRSSGAAGIHQDKRARRKRTRQTMADAAVQEQLL